MAMTFPLLSAPRSGLLSSLRSILPILPLPTAIHLNLPTLIPGILDSILRAVPKKKQSHSRKRMRQLAGKGLQDVVALNKCPACGGVKRKNMLCDPCVESIKDMWRKEAAEAARAADGGAGGAGAGIWAPPTR